MQVVHDCRENVSDLPVVMLFLLFSLMSCFNDQERNGLGMGLPYWCTYVALELAIPCVRRWWEMFSASNRYTMIQDDSSCSAQRQMSRQDSQTTSIIIIQSMPSSILIAAVDKWQQPSPHSYSQNRYSKTWL